VVPGRGAGFSLEAPLGVRFLIRSRLLSEQEMAGLGLAAAQGAPAAAGQKAEGSGPSPLTRLPEQLDNNRARPPDRRARSGKCVVRWIGQLEGHPR
jgi:hypothetical protein